MRLGASLWTLADAAFPFPRLACSLLIIASFFSPESDDDACAHRSCGNFGGGWDCNVRQSTSADCLIPRRIKER